MPEAYPFTHKVTLCGDGAYRWMYDVDMSAGGAVYRSAMKVLYIIAAVVAASGFFLPEEARLIVLLPAAGMIVVPALGWLIFYRGKNTTQRIRYEMNEERLYIPGLYKSEYTPFKAVLGVTAKPDENLIELRTADVALIQVFAPDEDYQTVRDFILNHVSPLANTRVEA